MSAGSFDIPAAEAVCAGGPRAAEDVLTTLIGLVDKSVVLRSEEDGTRYWLLDTIREFGIGRLDREEAETARDRHIAYFRALAADLRAYWEISGLLREGTYWLTKILARFDDPSAERARLFGAADVLWDMAGTRLGGTAIMEELHQHLGHIFAKLGISSRVRLATWLDPDRGPG